MTTLTAQPAPSADGPSQGTVELELAQEQAHVDAVYRRLDEATRAAEEVATDARSKFQTDRGDWAREEDGTGMFERDVFAFQAARRLAVLDAEHEGLVFGRLDRTDHEVRYIGRIGVRDDDYEPLVIDWRARAAEPFYRATPAEPMEVVRRRVLRCRGDKVIGIEDDLLDDEAASDDMVVVGEGALMAALSRARGRQMRDIVATIQAEQDEAIRAPYQGVTVIAGGPGTGKTVVALHRAAFLLYTHRRRFESGGVLVVGPSRVFMNYIERVLPSLGEEAVTLRAIGSVPMDVLGFRSERADDPATHAIKGTLRMVPLLRRLVNEPLVDDPELGRLRVTVKGEVLTLDQPQLLKIRTEVLRHHKLNQGRHAAQNHLLNALWQKLSSDVEIERELFDELVTDQAAYQMFLQSWWPPLNPLQVLSRLTDVDLVRSVAAGRLTEDEVQLLAKSYAHLSGTRDWSTERGDAGDWSIDDAALLDELAAMLGPVFEEKEAEDPIFLPDGTEVSEVVTTMERNEARGEADPFAEPHDTFTHVLVDEAQDLSPMQWRMLRRRGAQASWTIVGDPAQSSWPNQHESDSALKDLIGTAPLRRFRMSTNYRSPAEVFNLAARVVEKAYPEADLPTAVRSTGVDPLLLDCRPDEFDATLLAQLNELAGQVEGSIGVICPPSRLDAVTSLLEANRFAGADRTVVVTPLECKGLEYDAVIVLSPDDVVAESPGGVRVLYVTLTRPTQRLVTLDVTAPGQRAAWRADLD